MHSGKKKKMIFGGAIVSVLVLLVGVLIFTSKAEVVVYISPQVLEETEYVTLSQNESSVDYDELILPADLVEVQVSGSKSRSATGSKTIGDKTSGKVEIRNGTSVVVKLSAGTVLLSANDLEFELIESASVSAAVSPSSPGSEEVNIVAIDIGADYNLAKDEELSVGNYPKSEVDARVIDGLGGGSSEEIIVVSADDIDALEEELIESLITDGQSKMSSESGTGNILVDGAIDTNAIERKFSHQEGDEADSVSLDLELQIIGVILSENMIREFAAQLLKENAPEGFALRLEQIEIEFSLDEEVDEGEWIYEVSFVVNLLPEIDPDEIASRIVGNKPDIAEQYLRTISGHSRSEIKIKGLSRILGRLPYLTRSITIEAVADR